MAGADISLLFGVAGEGALSGESGKLIQSQLTQIMAELNKNPLKVKVGIDTDTGGKKSWGSQLQAQLDKVSTSGKFSVQISTLKLSAGAVNDFKKQLGAIVNTLGLSTGTEITISAKGIGEIKNKLEQTGAAASDATRKIAEFKVQMEALGGQKSAVKKSLDALAASATTEAEKSRIAEITAQYEQWAIKIEEVRAAKSATTGEHRAEIEAEGAAISATIEQINQERIVREAAAQAAVDAEKQKAAADKESTASQIQRNAAIKSGYVLLTQMQKAERDWTMAQAGTSSSSYAGIQSDIEKLKEYQRQLKANEITVDEFKLKLSGLQASFAENSNAIKAAGENVKTLGSRFSSIAKSLGAWFSVSRVIMYGIRSIRNMVTATIELDDAMTQLKIVTQDTDAAYEKYLDTVSKTATKIGSSISDLIDSTTTYARLGYSLEESSTLAEYTAMLQNVGDINVSDAQDAITAIVKAFGVGIDEIETIMDKMVATGNNFPISVSQIAEGMNNASSALAAAGNTFEQSVALLTAANTTIQNAAKSSVGMRTIAARIRSTKTELDELGESMTEAQYGELVSALTKYNVALTDANGEFRSTYDIIADIAAMWDKLSTMEQAALANSIAGVRQQSVFYSLVEQFQEASGAMDDMANSAGTLQESYDTYMESTTAHINQFKAALQSLSQTTISTEFLNGIIDFGTGILGILETLMRLIDALGGLNTVLTTTAAIIAIINADAIFASLANIRTGISRFANDIVGIVQIIASGFMEAKAAGASSLTAIGAGFKSVAGLATTAQIAMGAFFVAVLAISGAVAIYKKLHKSTEELVESSNELKESFRAVKEQAEDNITTLQGLSEEFVRLADGVDRYGRNVSLSANDYERYKEIIEQIVGISPELIEGYDKENGYLVDKNSLLERAIELQEQEYRNELRRMATTSNISTAVAGSVATYSDLEFGDALKTETSLTNAIYRLFNVNERKDIPKEMESGEFLARQIMEALGVENVDKELEKYFNEHGYWQSGWFFDDYIDQIAEDIGSSRSLILPSIDFEAAGFESSDAFVNAVEEVKSAASEYSDVQSELAQANKDVADQLKLVAESNQQYADLSSNAREIISDFVNSFGVDDITKAGWFGGKVIDEDAINRIKVEINEFVEKFTPEIQELVDTGFSLQLGLDVDGSELSVEEYQRKVKELLDAIDNVEDEDLQLYIRTSLGIDEDSTALNNDIERAVQHAKNLLQDEFDDEVSNLSVSEVLQIYYNISASKNSMTFEELQEKLEYLNVDWSKTINVWDFSSVVDGLSDIESGVSDVASAMNTLQSGTALTVAELAKLAMKYPDLLKASDLFTDTSISNQQELLNSVLGSYEAEYDALIDTKIAELTATNELIQKQIELENEKKNKVVEIADLQANGKLDSEAAYQRLLNELHDLEGQNFVTYSDGVLDVNEEMLGKMLEQQGDEVDSSKPIWGALGDMIIEGHSDGLTGALKTFPQYLTKLKSWAGSSLKTLLSNIGTNIGKALSGDTSFVGLTDGIQNLGQVSVGNVTIETQIEGDYTIDGKSVDDWSAEYKDNIEKRVQTLTDQITANQTIISNLEKMKGLDLKSLYGGSGSSSRNGKTSDEDKDELEEYLADIDAYYEALKRLEAIQIRLSSLQSGIENAGSEREKIALTQQLINVYRDEIDALEVLNSLRSNTIRNGIKELEALGFEIDYNSETNEFMVRNMEHLNELEGDTQEQTNELRESTEDLINTLDDLNAANQEGADSLRDFNAEIQKAKQNVIDYLKDLVTTASDAVDEIQNVFDVLKAAADEFADNGGFISVDAFQKIIELGPQYMQYLQDENGLLVINEESINRVIEAKVRQLAAEQALTYVERIRLALQEGAIENLDTLLFATTKATDATFGLAYAELELMHSMGDLNDSQYAAALHNIQAIEDLANTTVAGIGKVSGEYSENLKKELENMKAGLDDILKYVMDMLKHRIQQQIDALEELKDAYADIIDLRKEALDAAKKEAEYEDKVADKVKQIAKLQEQINALSLDDSRDAQAKKIKLEEEMAELQKELADDQSDYAVDAQKEALDDMQTAYENEKDAEIKALEETISSYQKLYDMAIAYIEEHWNTLYDELIAWNTEYGSVLNSEITTAWENCLAAAQRYGSYVSALNNIDADIAASTSGGTTSTGGTTNNRVVGTTGNHSSSSSEDSIHAIIKEMYANSQEHHTATQERKKWLDNRNLQLGTMLSQYGVKTHRDNGTWYMDGSSQLLYDKYRKYIYHKGGIAGDNPTLKQNEIMAVLEKGEAVLDDKKQQELHRLIQFTTKLSDEFGELMKSTAMPRVSAGGDAIADAKSDVLPNISNNEVNIEIGPTYIYGTNEDTVEQHREVTRKFTNEILSKLNIKR